MLQSNIARSAQEAPRNMGILDHLLEERAVYALWQAPFAADKLAPLLRHNDLATAKRVLDVGCGPGTNSGLFAHADYIGIDINPKYIEYARQKYQRTFFVADAVTFEPPDQGTFDFVLVNSFLHHIDDRSTKEILDRLAGKLSVDGFVHFLELVLPEDRSLAKIMARSDRGRFPRPLEDWRKLFGEALAIEIFEPYSTGAFGATLWNMVYCKAKARL